jgi:hypothetical protein
VVMTSGMVRPLKGSTAMMVASLPFLSSLTSCGEESRLVLLPRESPPGPIEVGVFRTEEPDWMVEWREGVEWLGLDGRKRVTELEEAGPGRPWGREREGERGVWKGPAREERKGLAFVEGRSLGEEIAPRLLGSSFRRREYHKRWWESKLRDIRIKKKRQGLSLPTANGRASSDLPPHPSPTSIPPAPDRFRLNAPPLSASPPLLS